MKISIIAAISNNRVIGYNGEIPWHLPNDLKRFKQITMGCPIIMGRKTYESIGKALPGRRNFVVTRSNGLFVPDNLDSTTTIGCGKSLESIISVLKTEEVRDVFIIGGGEIYKQAIPLADTIHLTVVNTTCDGDTFFPSFESDWNIKEFECHPSDEKHAYDYEFQRWEKK